MASQVPPKKATAFNLGLCLYTSSGGLLTNPSSVAAVISKDFGAYNAASSVSVTSTTYGQVKLALDSTEMNADIVMARITSADAGVVPYTVTIYTARNIFDDALGIIGQGTAQQSSSNSLTLASTAAFATNEIVGATLLAAGGQPRMVLTYDSTSKIATVDAYVTTPSSVAPYLLFGTPPASALSVPGVRVVSMDTNVISAAALTSSAVSLVADGLLNRDMSVGADSGSSAVRTPRQALRFLRNKWAVDGSTVTVMKEDDTTASWTAVLTASSAAVPITGADPA